MKVSEAEKLICPFMSNAVSDTVDTFMLPTNCITSDCMAWKTTITTEQVDFESCSVKDIKRLKELNEMKDVVKIDRTNYIDYFDKIIQLSPEDYSGYCIRLNEK